MSDEWWFDGWGGWHWWSSFSHFSWDWWNTMLIYEWKTLDQLNPLDAKLSWPPKKLTIKHLNCSVATWSNNQPQTKRIPPRRTYPKFIKFIMAFQHQRHKWGWVWGSERASYPIIHHTTKKRGRFILFELFDTWNQKSSESTDVRLLRTGEGDAICSILLWVWIHVSNFWCGVQDVDMIVFENWCLNFRERGLDKRKLGQGYGLFSGETETMWRTFLFEDWEVACVVMDYFDCGVVWIEWWGSAAADDFHN